MGEEEKKKKKEEKKEKQRFVRERLDQRCEKRDAMSKRRSHICEMKKIFDLSKGLFAGVHSGLDKPNVPHSGRP